MAKYDVCDSCMNVAKVAHHKDTGVWHCQECKTQWNWTPRARRIGWALFWLELFALYALFIYELLQWGNG
jgi:hypothetical protein